MVQIKQLFMIDLGTYTYNQNLDKFDWKLQEEQKEILGYNCKKATTEFGRIMWHGIHKLV
jgi:GLPGLI family protein